LQKGKWYGVKI